MADGYESSSIERLARIEQKVDEVCRGLHEQRRAMFGSDGLEPRVRRIEMMVAVNTTKIGFFAALVAATVSVAVSVAIAWLKA